MAVTVTHVDAPVFYARRAICLQCEFWRGVCLKGHALQGNLGCPLLKFEGMNGEGYLPDQPVPQPALPPAGKLCCGAVEDLKPLTWPEVWKHLVKSTREWQAAGYPITPAELYRKRIRACKSCRQGQYQWFQCKHCKCVVYTKALLATETCPFKLWPAP
jgi:hypothetical protein